MSDLLTRLLWPIARLSIARGLGVRDLSDPLKRAFLLAAQEDGAARQTDSRLALVTGLQRRDVVRLRDAAPRAGQAPVPARVLTAWPEDLPDLARSGPAPSFEALAATVSRDVHPRSLLDVLVAAGAVSLQGEEVRLERRDFVPSPGSDAQLGYLADNLHDHGAAAVANVLAEGAPVHFDRAAHFTGLTEAQVAALSGRFRLRQMALLQEIAQDVGEMESGGPLRVRFGGYSYWEEGPCPEDRS